MADPVRWSTSPGAARVTLYKALLMGNEIVPLSNGVFRVPGRSSDQSYQPDGVTNLIARAPDCIYNAEGKFRFLDKPAGTGIAEWFARRRQGLSLPPHERL